MAAGGWRLGYRRELDGLRGVAIALVVAGHVLVIGRDDPRFAPLGSAGVTLFFVLSGFLITSLLVEERAATGTLDLRRFYWRRAVRLGPALLVLLAFTTGVGGMLGSGRPPLLPVVLYFANWVQAYTNSMGVLGHTWSLSIEEQFYVLWPGALALTMRWRRAQLVLVVLGIVASTYLRFAVAGGVHGSARAYYGSDTEAASLLVGCLIALLAHRGLRPWKLPVRLVNCLVAGTGLVFLLAGAATADVVVPTLGAPLAGAVIWIACSSPGGVLAGPVLRYLGTRSYGLYLWNYVIIAMAVGSGRTLVGQLAGIGVSLVLAEASWRLVERPLQKRLRSLPGLLERVSRGARPRVRPPRRLAPEVARTDVVPPAVTAPAVP